jgi:hypothetical protein
VPRILDSGRRPLVLLATAALAAVPLAACGGSKNEGGTISAVSYMSQLCNSAASWLRTIETHTRALEAELGHATPAEGKRVLETLLSNSVSDTQSVVNALRTAGVPKVSNGKHISELVVSSFEDANGRLGGLQSQVASVPTNNPAAFQAAARKIREQIREAPLRLGIGLAGVNSKELEKAASESPVCKSVGARPKSA